MLSDEEYCFYCESEFGDPILITRKAVILTSDEPILNVCTYIKKCNQCSIPYRYISRKDGLHNYNNKVILSVTFAVEIRNAFRNHQPPGSSVKAKMDTFFKTKKKMFTFDDLRNAWYHFETSTNHTYPFYCIM